MYDTAHYQLTFGGTQVTDAEIWQCGLRYAPSEPATAQELLSKLPQISVSDIFDDVSKIIQGGSTGAQYTNSQRLTFAKLAVIGQDGKYAGAPKAYSGLVLGPFTGSSASPPQLALCVTLDSEQRFGRAQKGRIYLPCPYTMVMTEDPITGQIPSAAANHMRDKVDTMIDDVQGEISTIGTEVYAAIMSPAGAGTTNPILRLAVGTVIDTQRRRRSALVETYSYVAARQRGRFREGPDPHRVAAESDLEDGATA